LQRLVGLPISPLCLPLLRLVVQSLAHFRPALVREPGLPRLHHFGRLTIASHPSAITKMIRDEAEDHDAHRAHLPCPLPDPTQRSSQTGETYS
jgi:hypothetical protein